MIGLKTEELIYICGGAISNCFCNGSGISPKAQKIAKDDGPSCACWCCGSVSSGNTVWVWFGSTYSVSGQCVY